jgi:glycosyltransferase involved in cell wall biosynthesis
MRPPRVAYFPDSFHEVNGVAHTSRNFAAYAQRHNLPLLCVRAGNRDRPVADEGSVRSLELPRSTASVTLEKDLAFDPFFWRHADLIEEQLLRFEPDLLHMTGPSELGFFAVYFAWKLRLPLAASWHTNVHEYAARRLAWLTAMMPPGIGSLTDRSIENTALETARVLYDFADVLFAPNPELCGMLARTTAKPVHIMRRGVDTSLFAPAHRTRPRTSLGTTENPFVLGYVGRLSIEKNVSLLPRINRQLLDRGLNVRFLIVGHGVDEDELRRELPNAEFAGVLRGAALAEAYANMDLFVFPSHTDTFGNVVLEALASGVPTIVSPDGGPRFIVRDREASPEFDETGVIAQDDRFAEAIAGILADPPRLAAMRLAAREYALECSWDSVFDRVYDAYRPLLRERLSAGSDLSPRWVVSSPR